LVIAGVCGGIYYLISSVKPENTPKMGMDGYAGNLKRSEDKARDVMHVDNAVNARNAVERFHTEKNRFPDTLQEAVDAGYLEHVPQGVVYDSSTGTVTATP
jgi:hypothetical protein